MKLVDAALGLSFTWLLLSGCTVKTTPNGVDQRVPVQTQPAPAIADHEGNAVGNGGDYVDAIIAAGLQNKLMISSEQRSSFLAEQRASFRKEGTRALLALLNLHEAGHQFKDRSGNALTLTQAEIFEAFRILKEITDPGTRFRLKDKLTINDKPYLAVNHREDKSVTVNPIRWNQLPMLYGKGLGERLLGMIAAHEMLSLLKEPREFTGSYPISSALISFEKHITEALDAPDTFRCAYPTFKRDTKPLVISRSHISSLMFTGKVPFMGSYFDVDHAFLHCHLWTMKFLEEKISRVEGDWLRFYYLRHQPLFYSLSGAWSAHSNPSNLFPWDMMHLMSQYQHIYGRPSPNMESLNGFVESKLGPVLPPQDFLETIPEELEK